MTEESSRRRRGVTATRLQLGRPIGGGWLAQVWWAVLLRAIGAVGFGALLFAWPRQSAVALVSLFGAFALFDGTLALIAGSRAYRSRKSGWLLLSGLTSTAAGVFAFTRPRETALTLVTIVGGWLVLRGAIQLEQALVPRSEDKPGAPAARDWRLALDGAGSAGLGGALLVLPHLGALTMIWGLGAWAILHGALMTEYALQLRGVGPGPGA